MVNQDEFVHSFLEMPCRDTKAGTKAGIPPLNTRHLLLNVPIDSICASHPSSTPPLLRLYGDGTSGHLQVSQMSVFNGLNHPWAALVSPD